MSDLYIYTYIHGSPPRAHLLRRGVATGTSTSTSSSSSSSSSSCSHFAEERNRPKRSPKHTCFYIIYTFWYLVVYCIYIIINLYLYIALPWQYMLYHIFLGAGNDKQIQLFEPGWQETKPLNGFGWCSASFLASAAGLPLRWSTQCSSRTHQRCHLDGHFVGFLWTQTSGTKVFAENDDFP